MKKDMKLRSGTEKIEPEVGSYWMRYPHCKWEIVYISFENNQWRIYFMGSNKDVSLNFEFKDADFVKIEEPVINECHLHF